jgi:hypothetical protein
LPGKSLVEDKTIDYQVWNQPLRSYEVLKNDAVDAKTANELITATGDTYAFNANAVAWHHIELKLGYIVEPAQHISGNLSKVIDVYTYYNNYQYILELDADGKIIGGEWLGASKKDHPDFLWLPTLKGWTEVGKWKTDGTGIKWHEVMYLVEQSTKVEGGDKPETGGFDWGSPCDSGDGSFAQPVLAKATIEVGEIPEGKADVRIDLVSDNDVDIQLIDKQTGTEIVAWPSGLLSGPAEQTLEYEGMTVVYSGYNGVGGDWGREFIEIKGNVTRTFIMKAFGYKAGQADVTYSYKAPEGCVDTGDGTFSQEILKTDIVRIGDIPTGKENIRIELKSSVDVDVQLYAGPVALVKWPDGKMSGYGKQSLEYEGMTITWSGYNGDGSGVGNEYITISGKVPSDLTMRAFGYKPGQADVKYAWGIEKDNLSKALP